MKRLTRALGLALLLTSLAACGGPVGPMPGFRLDGPPAMQPVRGFLFARYLDRVDLQIRPSSPFSVRLGLVEREGWIYVWGPSWSYWVRALKRHPEARARLAVELYDVTAVQVTDPTELESVGKSGVVFRLDPRVMPELAQSAP